MKEIYSDIPDYIKTCAKFWVDLALKQKNFLDGLKMIEEYRKSCISDYEKEFVDFYFNYRIEALKNESDSDFS